jgi:cytochrome oxidase Cu insertion factor (SCO1/SenC/PrrC family)
MSFAAEANETPPLKIAEHVLSIRRSPARREELVALLAEQSAVYRGLGTGEAERIRGFVLASFEQVGLPESALPFVLEELETGYNPYTVAAAAKALRGASQISDHGLKLLVAAAGRIKTNDDNVQYDSLDPTDPTAKRTSALAEIIRTIAASGARARQAIEAMADARAVSREAMAAMEQARRGLADPADQQCCCSGPPPAAARAGKPTAFDSIDDIALQDQSGTNFQYRDFFKGRPSVVTFFYTRCMNPRKCSLTVSKLAGLQRRLAGTGLGSRINIAAFTYDPGYDRPSRLQIYGIERGFRFDDQNRFMRTVGPFEPIQARFDLGVGFGPATANRHSVELLILDSTGEAVHEFRRVLWDEAEVLEAVRAISAKSFSGQKK